MSPAIDPSRDPTAVAERQTPPVEASTYREDAIRTYLQAFGGDSELTVRCDPDAETGYIEQDSKEEDPTITLPARDFRQPYSEYPQGTFNRILQYGIGLHEYGHDQYTAQPYWVELFDRQTWECPQFSDLYWDLSNAIEDHRIEKAIINDEGKWAEQRLDFVNLSFVYTPPEEIPRAQDMRWASALVSAAIHYGKARGQFDLIPALEDDSDDRLEWRSDDDREIYNSVVADLKATIEAVGREPDGKVAVDRIFEFLHTLDEYLADRHDTPQRDESQESSANTQSNDRQNDAGGQKTTADSLDESADDGDENDDSGENENRDEQGEDDLDGNNTTDEDNDKSAESDESADEGSSKPDNGQSTENWMNSTHYHIIKRLTPKRT